MRVRYKDKLWDKEEIQALIERNDAAVSRALMVVWSNQTKDEQVSLQTKHENGIGFTGRDAEWLSDIALKWQRWGRWASQKQLNAVRKAMKKYWRQLLLEMVEKGGVEIKGRLPKVEEQPDLVAEEHHQVIEPMRDEELAGSW